MQKPSQGHPWQWCSWAWTLSSVRSHSQHLAQLQRRFHFICNFIFHDGGTYPQTRHMGASDQSSPSCFLSWSDRNNTLCVTYVLFFLGDSLLTLSPTTHHPEPAWGLVQLLCGAHQVPLFLSACTQRSTLLLPSGKVLLSPLVPNIALPPAQDFCLKGLMLCLIFPLCLTTR